MPIARPGRAGVAVAAVAASAFLVSLVLQHTLYRYGSGDADEAAYVLQARMLLDGRLTLNAADVEPFFRPWLTGSVDGRVFTKYLPGWPAALAASQLLFGTMTVAPAAVAAAWVAGAYRLGRELFDDPDSATTPVTGLVAAGLVAFSPLAVLHSALPLAYGCTAAAATLASAALLRGVRTGSRVSLCLAGAGFGLALLVRPLDAVLVALGCLVFVAAQGPARWRPLPWAVLGGLPFVGLLLAYDAHVTGSPLRLPIPASDPLDTFGFGDRRILPGEPTFSYSQTRAVEALRDTLLAAPGWLFGGMLLVALAAVGLIAPGRRAARLMLAGTVVAVLVTYSFWWGSAFAVPGLRDGLGPHYHLAAFTPLVLLAARGAVTTWSVLAGRVAALRRRQVRPVVLAGVATAFATVTAVTSLPGKVDVQRHVNQGTVFVEGLVPDDLHEPAVVIVSPAEPSRFTQVPYHTLRNDPDLAGPVVFAADLGAATVGLVDRMPGRSLYRVRPDEILDAAAPTSYRGSFVPVQVVEATTVTLTVEVDGPRVARRDGAAYVRFGSTVQVLPLTESPAGSRTVSVSVSVSQSVSESDAPTADLGPAGVSLLGARLPGELVVGFVAGDDLHDPTADRWEQRFPVGAAGVGGPSGSRVLRVLSPGLGWQIVQGRYGGDWVPASVGATVAVTVTAAPTSP